MWIWRSWFLDMPAAERIGDSGASDMGTALLPQQESVR